jgi:uncharacterized protein YfaP (DUF2135 family)
LSWQGDDDLDLSVKAPVGSRVDHWNQFDSTSGGTLQDDTTPEGTGHVESIYFGIDSPAEVGRYRIRVTPYETRGDGSDSWTLTVHVGGQKRRSWYGTGAASYGFWYRG